MYYSLNLRAKFSPISFLSKIILLTTELKIQSRYFSVYFHNFRTRDIPNKICIVVVYNLILKKMNQIEEE